MVFVADRLTKRHGRGSRPRNPGAKRSVRRPRPVPVRRACPRSITGSEMVRRIWARDAKLWRSSPREAKEIAGRLGWLDVAEPMRGRAGDLVWFRREIERAGFTHAILLGMGGSSLAPEVIRGVFGSRALELTVLDTTDPAAVRAAEEKAEIGRTLFIVSSKSGSTIEVDSLYRYFYEKAGCNGRQFVAITDPGTALARRGWEKEFRRTFINPPDIGGRFSALSCFGMVPAALLGADAGRLLDSGLAMMRRCGPRTPLSENPGFQLGRALGEAAREGRNKVTLVLPRSLETLGLWIEQLLAESTGKEGTGLIPVAGESLGRPEAYGADRIFVGVEARGGGVPSGNGDAREAGEREERLADLERAGHPVIRIRMAGPHDLGGEFFRWEFATAVAGALLGVNPFDQPNVQEAKDRTRELLGRFEKSRELPGDFSGPHMHGLHLLLSGLIAGRDYLGVLAFLPFDPRTERVVRGALDWIRDRKRVAVTFGYGPRYLHSTGQLHKGGPDSGVFIIITADSGGSDLAIPGATYTFGELERCQALGDLESLSARGRRVMRLHLADPAELEGVMSRIVIGEGGKG